MVNRKGCVTLRIGKALMNTDLGKFNVVNSLATCENTGTVSHDRVQKSITSENV